MMLVLFATLLNLVSFSSHPRNRNIYTKVTNCGSHVQIYTSMKGISNIPIKPDGIRNCWYLLLTNETADFLQSKFFSFKTESFYLIHPFDWMIVHRKFDAVIKHFYLGFDQWRCIILSAGRNASLSSSSREGFYNIKVPAPSHPQTGY